MPTEYGTVLHGGRTPIEVAAASVAGAVIMGKTVTTELAVYSPGKTRNPHSPTHTPGGSVSGSAAAVAADMVPLAIGSQTIGSVIRPAAYRGVYAYKPTHGLVEDLALIADYRMGGPGAEVFRRLGAIVVLVPGSEIVQLLQSGAIDGCEWIGPWVDTTMGVHQAARFYCYPGCHEPGTALALGINRRVWESFDDRDRRLIEVAAAGEYAVSLAEFNTNNALALRKGAGRGYHQDSPV